MNVQKTLLYATENPQQRKKMNLQNESRNEKQLIYRKMNADWRGKRFYLKKKTQEPYLLL